MEEEEEEENPALRKEAWHSLVRNAAWKGGERRGWREGRQKKKKKKKRCKEASEGGPEWEKWIIVTHCGCLLTPGGDARR